MLLNNALRKFCIHHKDHSPYPDFRVIIHRRKHQSVDDVVNWEAKGLNYKLVLYTVRNVSVKRSFVENVVIWEAIGFNYQSILDLLASYTVEITRP
jgi:hypothetical protein